MKTDKIKNLLFSISGGRSSAMMTIDAIRNPKYSSFNKVVVFANTGLERIETINFLRKIEHHINVKIYCLEGVYPAEKGIGVRHKIVEWDDLNMTGQPMADAIKARNYYTKFGLPNNGSPYCSEYTKKRVIDSFCRDYFNGEKWLTAIGFRLEDMPKRVVPIQVKKIFDRKIYPLLSDYGGYIGIPELDAYWEKMPFKLEISGRYGNCTLCFKKSDLNLLETIRDNPRVVVWYDEQEQLYKNSFFRGHKTVRDLIQLAENRFGYASDENGEPCFCG